MQLSSAMRSIWECKTAKPFQGLKMQLQAYVQFSVLDEWNRYPDALDEICNDRQQHPGIIASIFFSLPLLGERMQSCFNLLQSNLCWSVLAALLLKTSWGWSSGNVTALDLACTYFLLVPHLYMLPSSTEQSCPVLTGHAHRAPISSSVSHDAQIPDNLSADLFQELNVAYPESGCFSLAGLGEPSGLGWDLNFVAEQLVCRLSLTLHLQCVCLRCCLHVFSLLSDNFSRQTWISVAQKNHQQLSVWGVACFP